MNDKRHTQRNMMGLRRSVRLAALQKREETTDSSALVGWAEQEHPLPESRARASEKPNAALKSGLAELQGTEPLPQGSYLSVGRSVESASGYWELLPEETIECILKLCTPPQLGMLQTTCSYFYNLKMIGNIAKQKLRQIPRARGLKPSKRQKENYVTLLQFVNCQSAAAAQATAVSCGANHTVALMIPDQNDSCPSSNMQHTVYSFGRGFHGQLGNSSFNDEKSPVSISLGYRPAQDNPQLEEEIMPAVVACGSHFSAAISRRGELFTWGLGSNGELGQGRWTPLEVNCPRQSLLPQVRIVSVTCGANHTLAIGEAGTLWSCGKSYHGQLGLVNLEEHFRLQMVQNLEGYRIVSAAAGTSHSMALASDGSLFTWGEGNRGQLGHSQLEQMAAMVPPNNLITIPMPQKISRLDPTILDPCHRITAIAAGSYHSMALTVGGNVIGFGGNGHGCLGLGDTEDRWKPTKIPLALDGEDGQRIRVVQLICGTFHSVALVSNRGRLEVRTAGCNAWGQLGQGDRRQRNRFTPTAPTHCPVAIQAGEHHTVAVNNMGGLYLWGRGDYGQLGLGSKRARWKPTLVKNYKVVHPDRTLRRNKRCQPCTRMVEQSEGSKKQCKCHMNSFM